MVTSSKKSDRNRAKKAYTMIELSIVLIIAGLLVATVLVGGSALVRSARVSNARSATSDSPVPITDGLIAWYECSIPDSFISTEIVANSSNLSTWYDRSPLSLPLKKNALTTTASTNVTYKFDGMNKAPSIVFSGSGKLSIANFYQGSFAQATIFVTFNPTSTSGTTTLLDSGPSNSTYSISISSTAITLNAGTAATTSSSGNPASIGTNKNYIIAAYFNNSSSKVYLNDTSNVTGNGSALNAGSNIMNGLTVGANNAGSSGFNGQISEVIIFNRLLNVAERKAVMQYLAKKYQVTVNGF